MAGTTTHSALAAADGQGRDDQALRADDPAPHAHGSYLEARHRQACDRNQLVCGLQAVQDGREAQIEHAVECQHVHAHGNNDIKIGILANSLHRRLAPTLA